MKPSLRNEREVKAYLSNVLKVIVDTIMEEIEKENDKALFDKIYSFKDKWYQRTENKDESFRKAWKADETIVKPLIGVAHGRFTYHPENMSLDQNHWQHGSIYPPNDVRSYLAEIIYLNKSGPLIQGDWRDRDRNAWAELEEAITPDKLDKWIKKGARKAGLTIEQ